MNHPQYTWALDPLTLLPIVILTAIYVWRFRQVRRESGPRGAGWKEGGCFALGVLFMLAAVASPISGLGEDYLFSAHMLQHILLGDIAPLFFLLALSRVIMRPATRRLHRLERKLGPLAHPATFIFGWLFLIGVWHIPAMYDAALEHPLAHGLEHASFFTAGTLLWWPLIQPVPMRYKMRGTGGFAYTFAAKFSLAVLGLYLTWSTAVAYDYYNDVPRIWGLSPIADQNVGGAMMMVEQAIVLVIVESWLFVKMLNQSEQDDLRRERLEDAAEERERAAAASVPAVD